MVEFTTSSAKETEKLGESLAHSLRSGSGSFTSILRSVEVEGGLSSQALIIALNGELGAGKTTFIKGFARGLGIKETVTSPTYVFVRSYSFEPVIRQSFHKDTLYHLDLYRLDYQDKKTLQSFGFDEILSDPKGIVVIEWAEMVDWSSHPDVLALKLEYEDKFTRRVTLEVSR